MRVLLRRSLISSALLGALFAGSQSVWAVPIPVGPPPLVDGKPIPMPTVKKWGQFWFPASLVGFNRGIEFAYDQVTGALYADGSKLELDSLFIDGVVYIPLQPQVGTEADLRPGLVGLEARRSQYEAMEKDLPERAGNTDALFMETEVEMPEHPWAESATAPAPSGPIIDLDPTGQGGVPAHLRPGALPPQKAPANLPNRLPRPGEIPTSQSAVEPEPVAGPATTGIPLRVATQGGPPSSQTGTTGETTSQVEPVTPGSMQPIPYSAPVAWSSSTATGGPIASPSSDFAPTQGKNQVFEVAVLSGSLKSSQADRLMTVKLSQKNLSPVAQANLGTFAVRCQDGTRVEPVRSRSVLPDGVLAPGQLREGELLFRLSPSAVPQALELEGTLPLTVKFR